MQERRRIEVWENIVQIEKFGDSRETTAFSDVLQFQRENAIAEEVTWELSSLSNYDLE